MLKLFNVSLLFGLKVMLFCGGVEWLLRVFWGLFVVKKVNKWDKIMVVIVVIYVLFF